MKRSRTISSRLTSVRIRACEVTVLPLSLISAGLLHVNLFIIINCAIELSAVKVEGLDVSAVARSDS
jgi:hypothetical protein